MTNPDGDFRELNEWLANEMYADEDTDEIRCPSCINWNHWHRTADGTCEGPRCECTYRPKEPRD